MVARIKKIRSGRYTKMMQYHKQPSRHLPLMARMLACLPGLSEAKALEIWENINKTFPYIGGIMLWQSDDVTMKGLDRYALDPDIKEIINKTIGCK